MRRSSGRGRGGGTLGYMLVVCACLCHLAFGFCVVGASLAPFQGANRDIRNVECVVNCYWCAALAISDVESAGADGGADAARGREQDGLLRRAPLQSRRVQALRGKGEARWQAGDPGLLRQRRGGGTVRRAVAGGASGGAEGGAEGCSRAVAADERGGAAAGAGGGAHAARGREQDGLLWREPRQSQQSQALPGAGEARWQGRETRLLRHRRGGGAVHRAVAGGEGGGGEGCSGAATAYERGGAAAGAGGGADAGCGREQDGLLRRAPQPQQDQQVQALPGEGEARWQASAPGQLRHRRGGGVVCRAVAGGEGGRGGAGCSDAAADERGGAAAGAGGGADAARGREQDGLLRRAPRQSRPAQALPGAGVARWQDGAPGQLRHRRGGGAVRRALAGGAGLGEDSSSG
eukprot:scaffold66691_cov58-Phaeocystis_antarctica.AAC.4